jgi:hypothetical protein
VLVDATIALMFQKNLPAAKGLARKAAELDPTYFFPVMVEAWSDLEAGTQGFVERVLRSYRDHRFDGQAVFASIVDHQGPNPHGPTAGVVISRWGHLETAATRPPNKALQTAISRGNAFSAKNRERRSRLSAMTLDRFKRRYEPVMKGQAVGVIAVQYGNSRVPQASGRTLG